MRMSSTSFTHASTAVFGIAVAGYAAVRLISYAAPHLPVHLPGHHAVPAAQPVRDVAERHRPPERASRSQHRAATPTPTSVAARSGVSSSTGPPPAAVSTLPGDVIDAPADAHHDWPPRTGPTSGWEDRDDRETSHPTATSTPGEHDTHESDEPEDTHEPGNPPDDD
jgi:hypothetical protein